MKSDSLVLERIAGHLNLEIMPETIAQQFIAALSRLEADRDLDGITLLFADSSEIGNVVAPEKFHGMEGARTFWKQYRDAFEEVESTFRSQIATPNQVALEWTTKGTLSDGSPFYYEGVSILEFGDGKITRFQAYFDPRALGRQLESSANV